MGKFAKIASVLGITLVVFLAVILFILYRLVEDGELRRFLISELESRTELKVHIGEANLELGSMMGISFQDFALLDPGSGASLVKAESVITRVALFPLLEGRMVISELRFHQPALTLARDEEGGFPFVDMLLKALFEKQHEVTFSLDLRAVRVEKGEITLLDRRDESKTDITRFREMDLYVRRTVEKELIPPAAQTPPKTLAGESGEGPLEFSLKVIVEKDRERAPFALKGKMILPEDGFQLRKASLDVDVRAENLPATLLSDRLGPLLPFQSMRGSLSPRLHWRGSLARQVQVRGQVEFKRLEIHAPDIFGGALSVGEGRLDLQMDWKPEEIQFRRIQWSGHDLSLELEGSVRSLGEEDPYLEANLKTAFVPLVALRKYIPLKTLGVSARDALAKALSQGEVKIRGAGVSGRMSDLRDMSKPGSEGRVWFDAEVRGAGGDLPGDRYLPVAGVNGKFLLKNGILHFKDVKGNYGDSRFTDIDGSYAGVFGDRKSLRLGIKGDVDLEQMREQIKKSRSPDSVVKTVAGLEEMGGRGKVNLVLHTDFASSHQYEGRVGLDGVHLRTGDLSLSQIKGELLFSPKEIRADKVSALLSGSPIHIRAAVRDYLSDGPTFDLTVDSPGVKAGEVSRVLLSAGSSKDPGTVRGTVRYHGSLTSREQRELSGSLELVGTQLPLDIFSQPVKEMTGQLKFDRGGIEFHTLKGRLGGYGVYLSGRWSYRERPQLTFTLNSPEMDLALLMLSEDGATDDWYDQLQARGKVIVGKGRYRGFEFSDLSTDLLLENRVWRLDQFSARSAGGTVQGKGSFVEGPEGLAFSLAPTVQGVPVKGFLGWFDIGKAEITGKVNLTGKFESKGKTGTDRERNLQGNFQLRIEDGVARRFTLLVRILNLLDLSRWFTFKVPDLTQEGIRFRSITGDFKVTKGVYSTGNLFVDSDDLRITGAGDLDGVTGEVDFVIAVRPFPRVDSAVNYIPLLGTGLAAIKNSLLVASFRIRGPVDDPTITPAPLSTLSEFFFGALAIPKGIIGFPGDQKK